MRKLTVLPYFLPLFAFGQTWTTKADVPTSFSRHHPTTFTIDGVGYLMGGANSLDQSFRDFYSYDPSSDTWTKRSSFPGLSRGYSYAVNSETKGYVGFGLNFNPSMGTTTYLFDWWEYDPVTDSWTELAPFPGSARIHPAMVYLDGNIYMGCGGSSSGDLGDWWEYDIAADTWTSKADFPSDDRHHPFYFGIGDYVYVGMGHSGPDIFDDFYRYDPSTDSWTEMASLPAQGRVAGTQFSNDGKGYLLSGQGETHDNLPTGEFWEYDPLTDSWSELNAHPGGGRWAPGSFVIDGRVYLMCGMSNDGDEKDMMAAQISDFVNTPDLTLEPINIFPNPTVDCVQFTNVQANTSVSLYSLDGQLLINQSIEEGAYLNLAEYESGVYIARFNVNGKILEERIVLN